MNSLPKYNKGDLVQINNEGNILIVRIVEYISTTKQYFVQEEKVVDKTLVSEDEIIAKASEYHHIAVDIPKETEYYDEVVKVDGKMYYIKIQNITNKSI
jgi:hypothetical protein